LGLGYSFDGHARRTGDGEKWLKKKFFGPQASFVGLQAALFPTLLFFLDLCTLLDRFRIGMKQGESGIKKCRVSSE